MISAKFKRERSCKNSIRYKPIDDEGKRITSVIYLMNDSVVALSQPDVISVTMTKIE